MAIELSATKLRTFQECRYLYYLKYEAEPKIEMPASIHLVLGSAVHNVIRMLYRLNEKQRAQRIAEGKTQLFFEGPEALVSFWFYYWFEVLREEEANPKLIAQPRAIRFDSQTEEKIEEEKDKKAQLGATMLSKYHRNNVFVPWPVAVEQHFRVPAPAREDIFLVGSIDQVREIKGELYIVDLKTGWKDFGEPDPRVQFPVHHDYQFTIYSWAFEMLHGQKEAGIIRYPLGWKGKSPITGEKIDKRVIISPPRTVRDYAHLAQVIDSLLLHAEYNNWPRNYDDNSCRFCDYQEPCQSPADFIVSEPQEVSRFDWGSIDIRKIRVQLEEVAAAKRLAFSQPQLKLKKKAASPKE